MHSDVCTRNLEVLYKTIMQSPRWLSFSVCAYNTERCMNIYVCTYIYIVYEYIHIPMSVRGIWRYSTRRSCSLRVDYVLFCTYIWEKRQVYVGTTNLEIQGGEDLYDSLSCKSFFCKRATNCRALLRKMTYNNKASYGSSPPCTAMHMRICIWGGYDQ